MSDNIALPVEAGLAAGIFFIAIFAIGMGNPTINQSTSSKVIIPEGAALATSGKTFEPSVIRVVIGINNTVLWITKDNIPYSIEPNTNNDPNFVAATKDVLINSGHPFEYTFTKDGKFGYHSKPWMQGEVDVLPSSTR